MRGTSRAWRVATAGLVVATTASCTQPILPEKGAPSDGADQILTSQAPDPAHDELVAVLGTLTSTVTTAHAELQRAATSDNDATARNAAAAALELLLDDPQTTRRTDPALFPARTTERDRSGAQDDLLSATLTAARETGDDLGRATVEVLREPIAGDLGAWERDAEGVVASAAGVVRGARNVEAVAEEVRELLPGDGVRALAWTLLATETVDAAVTRAAAERASAHLSVVLIALELLDASSGADEGEGAGPDDAAEARGPDDAP